MKKIILILFLIFAFTGSAMTANLVIEAKKQTIQVEKNKGYFEGDVKVSVDSVTVQSPRAELDLDPKSKKPSLATFFDNPYAFEEKDNKKHEIKAQIMKVSLIKKNILAKGNSQSIIMEDRQPIVTINADTQEYDTVTKVMKANGAVIVNYKDAQTFSDSGTATIDKNGDIKNLSLAGHVVMKEKANIIKGDRFDYHPERDEYQVSGNTSSDITFDDGSRVFVSGRYQMFNKTTMNMMASGNVKVIYKDYTATGPKAQVLVDQKTKKPNEIIFSGRSKITQENNTVEADRIKITLRPKAFFADGNVKTSIKNDGGSKMEF